MIGSLHGTIESKTAKYVIVDVNGVGYKVFCSDETLSRLGGVGEESHLFTHVYVREDELDLYGFSTQAEIDMFELLISVSGIGPKGALSILSVAPIADLRSAIMSGNDGLLTKVSGIGKKTAQKIIIELKEKVGGIETREGVVGTEELSQKQDALDALVTLGYSQREAREALSKVSSDIRDVETKLKEALQILGKR